MKPFFALLFFCAVNLYGQKVEYPLQHFSGSYYGVVTLFEYDRYDNSSLSASKGWISIFETASGKEIIKEQIGDDSTEEDGWGMQVYMELTDGQVQVNTREDAFDGFVIYKDLNFDGNKDLSILESVDGSYGWHAYKIYLSNSGNSFVYNKAFTLVQNNYLGMFDVNTSTKRLIGFTKSGCCYHQDDEYIVEGNQLKMVKRTYEESYSELFYREVTQTKTGSKIQKNTAIKLYEDAENAKTLYSFVMKDNGKQVKLISSGETLYYIFQKKNGEVEFHYPGFVSIKESNSNDWEEGGNFVGGYADEQPFTLQLSSNSKKLSFANKSATYTIYETKDETGSHVGIEVYTGGKKYNLIGDINTLKGSLNNLKAMPLSNIMVK
ncbi:hypothetical protein C7N43_08360 [Sphingobacteriales bacterium UPWRP_1]|nr:hypothetical protein B6N25_09210 [Sphingobacteriales bacterium TSM_CSS]PSJ77461.1 hypothetical protein C7N43_08360 [Sphingobacteriales bacterium UPWRP_1]